MQAADVKLGKVLALNQVFVIPHFQRPYVWKEEENWGPLWADVRKAAEEVEAELAGGPTQQDPPTYFLGAVVTQDRFRAPQRLPSAHVIDGQQRLTTLQVLLAAARAVALSSGQEAVAGRLDGLIDNPANVVHQKHPADRQKLLPLPQDHAAFAWAVHRGPSGPSQLADHRLVQARQWFETTISDWVGRAGSAADRLDALHFALDERVQLVHINLHPRDDAQVIFEALNYRGTRLNPADLIKNLLFQTVDQQGELDRADHLLLEHWLPFDSAPWRDDMTSGRITRARVDVFIAHWLTMRSGAEVSVEHLFRDFKIWLHESGSNAGDVIEELRSYGNHYLALSTAPTTTPTGRLVDSMAATNTNTPWPVLLLLHGQTDIPGAQREVAAAAIDSFLMRRAVCGLTSKDYNNLMRSLLGDARSADPETVGDVITARLAGETAPSRAWPGDEQFRRELQVASLYRRLVRGRLRALLIGLDNALTTGKSESGADRRAANSGLTVEHLMPQKWRQHWPLPDSTQEAELARDDVLHGLGNLTLLTTKLNPSVGNKPWVVKRSEIAAHSLLRLTTSSVTSAPPNATGWSDESWTAEWDEVRIASRAAWLAAEAVATWPRPTSEVAMIDEERPRRADASVTDLIAAGFLAAGDGLVWRRPRAGEEYRCEVRADGQLEHPDGSVSATPSGACARVAGGSHNGWVNWAVEARDSVLLIDLHDELVELQAQDGEA